VNLGHAGSMAVIGKVVPAPMTSVVMTAVGGPTATVRSNFTATEGMVTVAVSLGVALCDGGRSPPRTVGGM
jgi:hypothetical protein